MHCGCNLRVALYCDSVLGESLKFHQAMKAPYHFDGNTEILCMQCRGIGPHLATRGKTHGFSGVASGPGVYSRVTAGMSIRNSILFIEVRNLSRYEGQLRNVNYAWQENTDPSGS